MTAKSERQPSRQLWLVHPAVVLAGVWAIALGAWYFAPASVQEAALSGHRASSTRALWFFSGCLLAFALASALAGLAGQRGEDQPTGRTPRLSLGARLLAAATLAGGALWLFRIMLAVGGPGALLDLFLSGNSIADLKFQVYSPAQLPPFTTTVHLAPVAVAALMVHRRLAGWSRLDRWLFLGLLGLAAVRSLLLAERLAALGVLAAIGVTLLFTSTISVRRLVTATLAGTAILWFAWSAGEFSRSWMDSRDGDEAQLSFANFRKSLSYSQERLGAYLFTAINNGVIIVDSWPGQSFPAHSVPFLSRTVGESGSNEARLEELFATRLNREYTGNSMPGIFYLDARELGIVLAALYGAIFGFAWRWAVRGSPIAVVLYASIVFVLIDSFRGAYLFDLQGIAGFAGAALLYLASRERTATPAAHMAVLRRQRTKVQRPAAAAATCRATRS